MNEEISSVRGCMNILREACGEHADRMISRYRLPVDQPDESLILRSLDQARRAHDQALASTGHESGGYDSQAVQLERVFLNTLRKWKGRVIGSLADPTAPTGSRLADVSEIMEGDRARSAIEGFILRNKLAGDRESRDSNDNLRLLGQMAKVVQTMLRGFDDEYADSQPRFGNGAVAEGLSVLDRWVHLQETVDHRFDLDWASSPEEGIARLCAVTKQWDKDRLITIEPYRNTWLQHKIRVAMGRALCRNGFRFLVDKRISGYDGPQAHRDLALRASVYASPESMWSTLDLSDASDSITYYQVLEVFPPSVMAAIDRSRTTRFSYPGSSVDYGLHMFGGMGNATTFLVETVMFYALVQASCRIRLGRGCKATIVGDDLMIKGLDETEAVVWGLDALGYKLNVGKSFWGLSTPVRESCGVWAFNGTDVNALPYYGIRKKDNEAKSLIALAEFVRGAVKPVQRAFHRRLESWTNTSVPIAGTISVCDDEREVDPTRIRYNKGLQRLEAKVLVPRVPRSSRPAEFPPGGEFAFVSRQVTTSPLLCVDAEVRRSLLLQYREQGRQLFDELTCCAYWRLILTTETLSAIREDYVDAYLSVYQPHLWRIHAYQQPSPNGLSLEHSWVAIPGKDSWVAIPGDKCSVTPRHHGAAPIIGESRCLEKRVRFDLRTWIRNGGIHLLDGYVM